MTAAATHTTRQNGDGNPARATTWLVIFGLVALLPYAFLAYLSQRFVFGEGHTERPIVQVVMLLSAAWMAWVAACYVVQRHVPPADSKNTWIQRELWPLMVVLMLAGLYRLILVPTRPIQEADLYRYLWDGRLVLAGINPYRYTPAEIAEHLTVAYERQQRGLAVQLEHDYQRLAEILSEHFVHNRRLFWLALAHHGGMPTTYPPLAQVVFAVAVWFCPDTSTIEERTTVLKAVLVLFDVATLLTLLLILNEMRLPLCWSVVYAWCPLVLKEVANSGHVDSVAVFFCVWAWWCGLRQRWGWAGLAWALAVLTKAYPLALLPILLAWMGTTGGRSAYWRFFGVAVPVLVGAIAWALPSPTSRTPFTGLTIFLTQWEMNDAIFHWTRRGLEWLLPTDWREWITRWSYWPRCPPDTPEELAHRTAWTALGGGLLAGELRRFALVPVSPAFVLAYSVHALVYLGLVGWLVRRTLRQLRPTTDPRTQSASLENQSHWFATTFTALAWLFLLLPTGNPWYFLWALPWLIWARQTAWYLLPGLLAQYYLYFWFFYHYPEGGTDVLGTGWPGYRFFHEVWVWIEYAPFFAGWLIEMWYRKKHTS